MHRAPMARRPGKPTIQSRATAIVQATRNAVDLPQDKSDVRRSRQRIDRDDACAGPENALLLFLEAGHETGLVAEIDDRQMEGIAELNEACRLLAGGLVHRATKVAGIVDHHANGVAVDPRE